MRNAAQIAIPVVVPRAIVLWGLMRLVFAALPLPMGEPFGSGSPSPLSIVLFAGVIGLVDVHVRRERILWANLGVGPGTLYSIYALAAIPGECLLALVLR